jgi:cytochrome c oxidase subunit II
MHGFTDWTFNLTEGVTPVSHDIYDLHMTVLWVCICIGIVVFGVMFYSLIHYRKSIGHQAATFHEHLWIEITWTIIPFIILTILAFPATRVLIHMRDTGKSDMTIKITGFQWKWQYDYLEDGIKFFSNNATSFDQIHNQKPKSADYLRTVDHPLVIPIHKKIRFLVTSNDVIHSWWVPDLGTKQDAVPGFISEIWTRVDRPGTYHGQCAELCGINHAFMPIVVIAMAEEDFKNWMNQQKGIAAPPQPAGPGAPAPAKTVAPTTPAPSQTFTKEQQMTQGEKIFNGTCAACHQTSGEGMPPMYPALKGSKIVTGPLPAHLNRVLFGKAGTAMQSFKDQFSDEELSAVITYERNSWGNSGEVVQPSDVATQKAKGPMAE